MNSANSSCHHLTPSEFSSRLRAISTVRNVCILTLPTPPSPSTQPHSPLAEVLVNGTSTLHVDADPTRWVDAVTPTPSSPDPLDDLLGPDEPLPDEFLKFALSSGGGSGSGSESDRKLWSDYHLLRYETSSVRESECRRLNFEDEEEEGETEGESSSQTEDLQSHEPEMQNFTISLIDGREREEHICLRLSDGAVLCVNSFLLAGPSAPSCVESLVRVLLTERVRPILVLADLESVLFASDFDQEKYYQTLKQSCDNLNSSLSVFEDDDEFSDVCVRPENGSVVFGSVSQGWGFTVLKFAELYAAKYGLAKEKLAPVLWGNRFYDSGMRKFRRRRPGDQEDMPRGFSLCLNPIRDLHRFCMEGKRRRLRRILRNLRISLTSEEAGLQAIDLFVAVMTKFLPLAESVLELIVLHLPSPQEAQQYRAATICDRGDSCFKSIAECNSSGVLLMQICRMIPILDCDQQRRFVAFGRVFSGTIRPNQAVDIRGPQDLFRGNVESITATFARDSSPIPEIPCGCVGFLHGIDQFVSKFATIVSPESRCSALRPLRRNREMVVRASAAPKRASDLPKLIQALKLLRKADPLADCLVTPDGDHVVTAESEIHLKCCVATLRQILETDFHLGSPFVQHTETVTETSDRICLAKSPNRHNRMYMTAEPLHDSFVEAVENGKISADPKNPRRQSRLLVDEFEWERPDSRKIWCFGPDLGGPNVLVNQIRGVQFLDEVKESVVAGFQWVTSEGFLCHEKMRGIRFNLVDVTMNADAIHRAGGQMIPTTRRVCYASVYTARPTLMQPIHLCEVWCPASSAGQVFRIFNQRRGIVLKADDLSIEDLVMIQGHIPVVECFGLEEDLNQWRYRVQFQGWERVRGVLIPGDDTHNETQPVWDVVSSIRERKGLLPQLPRLDRYLDAL